MPTNTRLREPDCRHCGQPLSALERVQGSTCRNLRCRRRDIEQRLAEQRRSEIDARCRAAARRDGSVDALHAAVVWLQPHATRLVRVRAAERRAQVQHLQGLAAGAAAEATPAIAVADDDSLLPDQACAFCRGRCCRHGLYTHAFVDRALLQRWIDARPGASAEDAAAAYAALLPAEHVEGSCLHHGRTGCTLPREMRSDICNRHACDGLVEARQRVDEGAPAGLIVAMPAAGGMGGVQRAAWLREEGAQALPRRPRASSPPRRR